MREIISVGVGACGRGVLTHVYSELRNMSHDHPEVYFHEDSTGNRVPRGIWVDLDSEYIGTLNLSHSWIPESSCLFGQMGAGNNWAKGYYTEGAEIVGNFTDM